jgi:hypothetical protein
MREARPAQSDNLLDSTVIGGLGSGRQAGVRDSPLRFWKFSYVVVLVAIPYGTSCKTGFAKSSLVKCPAAIEISDMRLDGDSSINSEESSVFFWRDFRPRDDSAEIVFPRWDQIAEFGMIAPFWQLVATNKGSIPDFNVVVNVLNSIGGRLPIIRIMPIPDYMARGWVGIGSRVKLGRSNPVVGEPNVGPLVLLKLIPRLIQSARRIRPTSPARAARRLK